MRDWLLSLHDALAAGPQGVERGAGEASIVRVVVANVRGSAPREAGASMLVWSGREAGSIGGGHLELVATKIARAMLQAPESATRLDRFPLAATLGQCCGGIVELWFQRYGPADVAPLAEALRLRRDCGAPGQIAALASRDPNAARYEVFAPDLTDLWLFGAGHVGRALVNVLAPLPFRITWVDSREAMIPAALPENVRALFSPQPAEEVADMAPGAWALVMTHSHDEDFALCEALLAHGVIGWAGVIGSGPKTKRFRQRLLQRGISAAAIARLAMPIGIAGIRSKEPEAIAVAVAAQLLQLREERARGREAPAESDDPPGIARES